MKSLVSEQLCVSSTTDWQNNGLFYLKSNFNKKFNFNEFNKLILIFMFHSLMSILIQGITEEDKKVKTVTMEAKRKDCRQL